MPNTSFHDSVARARFIAHVVERAGFVCQYCGVELEEGSRKRHPTVDHKLPRAAGGRSSYKNTVLCCGGCNQAKGSMPYEEWIVSSVLEYRRQQVQTRSKRMRSQVVPDA